MTRLRESFSPSLRDWMSFSLGERRGLCSSGALASSCCNSTDLLSQPRATLGLYADCTSPAARGGMGQPSKSLGLNQFIDMRPCAMGIIGEDLKRDARSPGMTGLQLQTHLALTAGIFQLFSSASQQKRLLGDWRYSWAP